MSQKKYKKAIEQSQKALLIFEEKGMERAQMRTYYFQILKAHLQIGNYEACQQTLLTLNKFNKEGSQNWFKMRELSVILHFHSKVFKGLDKIIQDTLNHRKYSSLPEDQKENWKILIAYLNLIEISLSFSQSKVIPTFKIARFMNQVPMAEKDKEGKQITIKIAEISYYILNGRFHEARRKTISISRHFYRYSRDITSQRLKSFLQLLKIIEKQAYHKVASQRHTQKIMEKLKTQHHRAHLITRPYFIEIIPFEYLGQILINSLPMRRQ